MHETSSTTLSGIEFSVAALHYGAVQFPSDGIILKSGRISPYFFNSGQFDMGAKLTILARAYHKTIESSGRKPDVLFGPAYKGIPLVSAIANTAWVDDRVDYGYCFDRKEIKDHGEGGVLVGADVAGKRVELIDDVITSGSSLAAAKQLVTNAGGIVTGVTVAFDRQERGLDTDQSAQQNFAAVHEVPISVVACLDDLIAVLERDESQHAKALKAYRDKYGI